MITYGEEITTPFVLSVPVPAAAATRRNRSYQSCATVRGMANIPDSTQPSLRQRPTARARERWPGLVGVWVRYLAGSAFVNGVLADGDELPLCRLRYAGYANQ